MSLHFIDFVGYMTTIGIVSFFGAKQAELILDMIPRKQVIQIVETVERVEDRLFKKKDEYEIKV